MLRSLTRYLGLAFLSMLLGFAYRFHLPQVKSWVLTSIQTYSAQKLPVHIRAEDLSFGVFPLGIRLENISVIPKEDLRKALSKISIQSLFVKPDLALLLLGRMEIAQVILSKIQLGFVVSSETEKNDNDKISYEKLVQSIHTEDIAKLLSELPVKKISLEDLTYYGKIESLKLSNMAKDLSLDVTNIDDELFVELKIPQFLLKETQNQKSLVTLNISSKMVLSPQKLHLTSLRINQQDSFLDLSFIFNNFLDVDNYNFRLKLNSSTHLPTLTRVLQRFNPQIQLPSLQGRSKLQLELDSANLQKLSGNSSFESLSLDGFYIGNLSSSFSLSKSHLKLENFRASQGKSQVFLPKAQFYFPLERPLLKTDLLSFLPNFESIQYDADLKVQDLDVEQLLSNLKLKDIPIELVANSERLSCAGKILPKFETHCAGSIQVPHFRVFNSENNFTIHAFKNGSLDGKVYINEVGVYPEASLKINEAEGFAKGSVLYTKGFQFDYTSDWFDYSNIENLANLDIQGVFKVSGSTFGNSEKGGILMQLESKDFSLEKYLLGDLKTKLSYKSGSLFFTEAQSNLPRSGFQGNLEIDLLQSQIQGKIHAEQFRLGDLRYILKEKLSIPVSFRAVGPLDLSFQGPLEFSKLDYQLKYRSKSFRVLEESFENLSLQLQAKRGHLESEEISIEKQGARVWGKLFMDPNLRLKGSFRTENLNLGSFNLAQKLNSKISSNLKAQVELEGVLSELSYKFDIASQNLVIGTSALGNSHIQGEYSAKGTFLEGDFFGEKVLLKTQIPSQNKSPFLFQLNSKSFNFSPLFYLVGINAERSGYWSELDANIDLQSNQGNLWSASGEVQVSKLRIQRGGLFLESLTPFRMKAKDGVFESNLWKIVGDDTSLSLQVMSTSYKKLNLSAEGQLNLSLASFLVPFVEDLRGDLQMSVKLIGDLEEPQLSGSAALKSGYFKIPNLNHPFENLRADILFNEKKIIFNKIDARFAGGKLLGGGNMELLGITNIPTKLSARLTDAKLRLVEGIELDTLADINLTGSWFPFLLTANAKVSGGEIKPITETSEIQKLRPSRYLPEVLLTDSFDPIELDVVADLSSKVQISTKELVSGLQGKINLKGPLSKLAYTGDLNLSKGGTLYFKDTGFDVENGSVKFKDDTQMNPEIYISGTTNITEQASGNNYDVEIILQGNLNNFSTKLSSQPSLSENDLISLLALGLTSTQLESQSFDNQRDLQMYEIGAAVLSQTPLSKEIKDKTGFNFSLHSDIDETNTTQYKVVISKQVTPKIGASASILGNNAKKDVKVEYKLNRGLSLIGSWESNTYNETSSSTTEESQSDIFGLDLRYKVEFK